MSPCKAAADHRFDIQKVDMATWSRAAAANATIDYRFGHRPVVERFLASASADTLAGLADTLRGSSAATLARLSEEARGRSLLFLALMLSGACNADCEICFTDRRHKRGETSPAQRASLLAQAKQLGCRYVYVPGEGEPTIDPGFWHFLEQCAIQRLPAVVFTNGLVFNSDAACRKAWGITAEMAIERLRSYPVSLYYKMWTARPALAARMLGVSRDLLSYVSHAGLLMPVGLARLLDGWPRDRLGLEIVVERRNADEVAAVLVPFAAAQGLARIVELIQHNGRVLGEGAFDPTPRQLAAVRPLLSVTSCAMAVCKAVVTATGLLSPRIGVLESQIPGSPVRADEDLFGRLHDTDYIVERRYQVARCLCESLPAALAPIRPTPVRVPASNIPIEAIGSFAGGRAPEATL